ncbi:MAG: peptidoglycan DD-metalloendopeptidase family protein [Flavobacteriales bacterium]
MQHLYCNSNGFYSSHELKFDALFTESEQVSFLLEESKTKLKKIVRERDWFSPLGFKLTDKNSRNIVLSKDSVPADADWNDMVFFQNYINTFCNSKIGWGGYLENRVFYLRSEVFLGEHTHRNIHLGIDIWTESNTPIYAIYDGEIYGFANNSSMGDYGYTIILKHSIDDDVFYSLYGHLSSFNFNKLKVGMPVKKGELIAKIGEYAENGNWPSHLHFQIMTSMFELRADFPGVCFDWQKPFFETVCLNPESILF